MVFIKIKNKYPLPQETSLILPDANYHNVVAIKRYKTCVGQLVRREKVE
jgi:hypothetical protein